MRAASAIDGKGSLGRVGASSFSDSSEFSFQFSGFLSFSALLISHMGLAKAMSQVQLLLWFLIGRTGLQCALDEIWDLIFSCVLPVIIRGRMFP